MSSVIRWVIVSQYHGLYIGQWLRRRDAIRDHCEDLGKSWKECRKKGDYVTKARITYVEPKEPGK